jgi:hypothetical protein
MAKKNKRNPLLKEWIVNCDTCGETILRGQWFCNRCGPPKSSPKSLSKGITGLQALVRISLLTVLFFSFAVYKLDQEFVEKKDKVVSSQKVKLESYEEELKPIHSVGVKMANVRHEPNGKIVMVLHKGEKIEVIRNEGGWLEVKAHDKSGWISENLITTRFE